MEGFVGIFRKDYRYGVLKEEVVVAMEVRGRGYIMFIPVCRNDFIV